MSFQRTEVSKDTYELLSFLEVTPKIRLRSEGKFETIKNLQSALSWVSQEDEMTDIELLAFSGEADPRLWNAVEKDLSSAINGGMKYVHCLGPVVCTDENGRNAILEMYRNYPSNVELYLFRTRALYHWARFSRFRKEIANSVFFRFHGESYHEPLAMTRKEFSIGLETKDDPFLMYKQAFWNNRQRDFLWLRPIMDKIVDVDKVPTLTFSRFKTAYEMAKRKVTNINVLSASDILDLSQREYCRS